jgi:predicted Zn-dependent protease
MAASKWLVYNSAKEFLLDGTIDLDTSAIRMKIVKGTSAAAVSDFTRSTFASAGTGVTWSGSTTVRTPGTLDVTVGASAKARKFDFDDVVFTASGALTSLQYAVIGVSNGKAIAWCKMSSAAFSVGAGSTLTVQINASGVFELTGGITA